MSSKGAVSTQGRKKSKSNQQQKQPAVAQKGTPTLKRKRKDSQEDEGSSLASGNEKHDEDVSNSENSSSGSDEPADMTDDEMDLADVSSSESEPDSNGEDHESEENGEDEDAFPRKKKSKISKHDDGSSGFSSAVSAILSSHLKAYDRKDPIMARNKAVLKKNDTDKLEQKAKKALLVEKKKLLNKTRRKEIIPTVSADAESGDEIRKVLEKERKLRKIAQKGVVKLFNAILATQVRTEKEVTEKLDGVKNRAEKNELLTELSKEKFLDLVKAAGDS
ncbi:LAFE_0F04720g1_1 [Lachancea fermentati]|uniref:LAFE_0F04720g1_1 n=1 Tax=Lachancea fermentati TaxID=4955 RepID=A0A1G4MEZ9_LACFM|nr:LAFE_0F04720g1_1 [Lachancea fermentati]